MPTIDAERLLGDLRRLAEFGRYRTGVHRPTYSAEDVAARAWLAERMAEAGLEPTIDGIGNVIGRRPGAGPRLLIGSHSESQNHAGWLDGALGVIYGLEVARATQAESGPGAVDVVSFADEEGHYGAFTGSRSFCGLLEEAEIDALANRYDGTPLRSALERAGYAGRPRQQIEQRMRAVLGGAFIQQEGDRADALGRQPHGTVHDGIAHVAFACERGVVPRRPARPPARLKRDQPRGTGGFALGRTEQCFDEFEQLTILSCPGRSARQLTSRLYSCPGRSAA